MQFFGIAASNDWRKPEPDFSNDWKLGLQVRAGAMIVGGS
jgi:hypothetical protein